jgi:acyl carrier protein
VTEGEILAALREVIERHLGLAPEVRAAIVPETDLRRDLALDSLQSFTLAVEVENRFRVKLSSDDEQSIATLRDLAGVVARRLVEPADGSESAESS